MSKCDYVALLLLFGVAVCNSLGLYPNVTLEDVGTPAETAPSNLFIYAWPLVEQERCPGIVTALEYCFHRVTNTPIQPVFTLLLLQPSLSGYTISQTINVTTRNFSFCSIRGGLDTCCERQPLESQNQFRVPSEIVAFGISATGQNRILGYQPEQQSTTMGFQIALNTIQNDNIILPEANMIIIAYRMFNFVIDPLNTTVNGTSISNGQGTSKPQLPLTDAIATTGASNSASTSVATDHSATTSISIVISSIDTSTSVQERPTNETIALGAPKFSSILVVASSVAAGCIITLLLIAFLTFVIYMCYRARRMQKSANVLPVGMKQIDIDQPTYEPIYAIPIDTQSSMKINDPSNQPTYESIYAVPLNPQSCAEINKPAGEIYQYTELTDTNGESPVISVDCNPAYGCNDYFESEEQLP